MKALDLFCGAGGAAMGLHRAGFKEIVGIDINPQPDYPFEFIRGDALNGILVQDFDLIWASPPCQRFTTATFHCRSRYPDLIRPTREYLEKSGKPFIIENVPQAPIRKDLILCGVMFGLRVYRHRHFEIHGFRVEQPRHPQHLRKVYDGGMVCVVDAKPITTYGSNKLKRRMLREKLKKIRGKVDYLKLYQEVMEMQWVQDPAMISEAVPPAYSEYIGKEFIRNYRGKRQ